MQEDFANLATASAKTGINAHTLKKWAQIGVIDAQKVSARLWLISISSAIKHAKASSSSRAGRPLTTTHTRSKYDDSEGKHTAQAQANAA